MCGGPSQAQTNAANSQSNLTNQLASQFQTGSQVTNPYYTSLVQNGLPYFNAQTQYSTSDLGQQIGQQQAQQKAQMAGYGAALPSGFATSAATDLQGQGAEAFDQNQMQMLQANEQAQLAGAQGLNPLAAGSAALQGNNSLMNSAATQANNFWGNMMAGMLGSYKKGGRVPETGPYLLHKDEVVLNKKQQKKMLRPGMQEAFA